MKSGSTSVGGAQLYFERRGDGPPLLLIVGDGGDCGYYTQLAERLGSAYTVLTYDRRGNSRSRLMNPPAPVEIAVQSDDAIAVLRANGFASARVFGNRGGATIALDLLARHPRAVRAAVVHEPPVATVLADPSGYLAIYDDVDRALATRGWRAAFEMFQRRIGGIGPEQPELVTVLLEPERLIAPGPTLDVMRRVSRNWEYAIRFEIRSFVDYQPDLAAIAAGNGHVALACGAETRDETAIQMTVTVAERLGVECVQFSGGHRAPLEIPDVFAGELASLLGRL